ncbi:MAG TPA: hypothetical protein VMG31_15230 [Verrucomicrobiae bacterium]|nr:hypothetical protein [Verrucomicrobiae bacterium]
MKFVRPTRAGLACALFVGLTLAVVTASANTGQKFSGYFDVSGVQEQGDMVQLTLHLQLFNHGSTDLKSVIVTLMDNSPVMTLRGNFQPVQVWKHQQFIEMSQEFTVTKREYAMWTAAGPVAPNLIIIYADGNGKTWQKGVQISHRGLVAADNR